MKNFARTAIKGAIIFCLIYAGTYVYQAIRVKQQVDSLDSNVQVASTEHTKQQFINGCMEESIQTTDFSQQQYCQCMVDELLKDYSANEIAKLGLEKDTQNTIKKLEPYAKRCLRSQGIEV